MGRTATCQMATACTTRSEEHTSELQSRGHLVCRLLLEKKTPLIRLNRLTKDSPGELDVKADYLNPGVSVKYFFFNDTATTEIYTLSLHDALPISRELCHSAKPQPTRYRRDPTGLDIDRKSTRLNSSHVRISYAVFCLKKKKHTSSIQARLTLVSRALVAKYHMRQA